MRLTAELAALCHRDVEDPGPEEKYEYFTDDDYVRATGELLAARPPGPFWLFAYGSLIWKPEFPVSETRRARAEGWRRAFTMRIERYRGSPEQPGYMMCLSPGGHCDGVALRLEEADIGTRMSALLYREVGCHEALEATRWIDVDTAEGPLRALTFYAHPHLLDIYNEHAPLDDVAHALARACGKWGSGAQYLLNTVSHLEALGIRDEGLWHLQDLVAREIELLHGCVAATDGI
jgi:cation transport protein ChaC